MPRVFLVEHYWPGVTQASFADATERVAAAVRGLAESGAEIRFMHSTLVPEDEAAYCVLSADSEQQVKAVYAAAGIPFERMLLAVESAMSGRSVPIPVDGETASPTQPHDGGRSHDEFDSNRPTRENPASVRARADGRYGDSRPRVRRDTVCQRD